MQSDLPWNVAGIPAEARDAARVAARREGLPLGEWLTRQILRSFAETAGEAEHAASQGGVERSAPLNNGPALREQAHDRLTVTVAQLTDRLARVERQTASDSIRDALKALHQGLSRLVEQHAKTSERSQSQLGELAGRLESVAGTLTETRAGAQQAARSFEQQIAALDERMRVVERTAYSSASTLDRVLEDFERMRATGEADALRQASLLEQLSGEIHRLGDRVAASEAGSESALARAEDLAARFGTEADASIPARLRSVEESLSNLMGRFEIADRASESVERAVGASDAETEIGDTILELHPAPDEPMQTADSSETVPEAASKDVEPERPLSALVPDEKSPEGNLPPLLDVEPPPVTPHLLSQDSPLPPQIVDLTPEPDPVLAGTSSSEGEGVAASQSEQADHDAPESYLAAARRSARAAAEEEQVSISTASGLSWAFQPREDGSESRSRRTRYALVGAIAAAALIAAGAGVVLSRGLSGPDAAQPPSAKILNHPRQLASRNPLDATAGAKRPFVAAAKAVGASAAPHTVPTPAPAAQAAAMKADAAPALPATASITGALAVSPAPSADAQLRVQKLIALANTGNARSELLLGLRYLDGDGVSVNEAEAARWLARAAQQGEAMAQYRLGTLYERGRGVPADPKQAAHWYQLAAKQGNRKAMHNLAVAFAEGSGVPKDYVQAAMWFSRAANLGLADSQFNLAVLYERGMGVRQSLIDAYKWYAIAAAHGDSESKTRIDALSTQLNPDDRAAAQQSAAAFKAQVLNPAVNTVPKLG